ncbi:MAG TPA: hypothetical protein VLQ93_23755 [Myxococcaceae bacterium]|nr:hypothetical protein [Myxococcaceae bacterium]
MLELCRALAAVHSAGVLHRDFKGDNVLVRDEDGEPVLVDFGVSAVPWAPRVTRDGLAPCTHEICIRTGRTSTIHFDSTRVRFELEKKWFLWVLEGE